MKNLLTKKTIMPAFIMLLLVFSLIQAPIALAQPSVEDKSLAILSDIYGLDLSKYTVTHEGTNSGYSTPFGPKVKQLVVDYTLISNGNKMLANLVFINGDLWFCNLDTIMGTPIYTQPASKNTLDQSRSVISRYQAYTAQKTVLDTSYISKMASLLNNVSDLKNTSVTEGNIKLNITLTTDIYYNIPSEEIAWFYTENNFDASRKAVRLGFTNGSLNSVSDTWNLYTIGSHDYISKDEALTLAWTAAQNCTFKFFAENGTIVEAKPDLSKVIITDTAFSMEPRNYNTLYPFWQIRYYFDKLYYSYYGIQVGIWADTKQVVYCQSLTHLGGTDPTSTNKPTENNATFTFNTLLIGCAVAGLAVAIATVAIVVKKKKKQITALLF